MSAWVEPCAAVFGGACILVGGLAWALAVRRRRALCALEAQGRDARFTSASLTHIGRQHPRTAFGPPKRESPPASWPWALLLAARDAAQGGYPAGPFIDEVAFEVRQEAERGIHALQVLGAIARTFGFLGAASCFMGFLRAGRGLELALGCGALGVVVGGLCSRESQKLLGRVRLLLREVAALAQRLEALFASTSGPKVDLERIPMVESEPEPVGRRFVTVTGSGVAGTKREKQCAGADQVRIVSGGAVKGRDPRADQWKEET